MEIDATEISNISAIENDNESSAKISSATNCEGDKSAETIEDKLNDNAVGAASELESISSNEDDPVINAKDADSESPIEQSVDNNVLSNAALEGSTNARKENVDGITNNTEDEPMDTSETQAEAESGGSPTVPIQVEDVNESEINTNGVNTKEQVNEERSESHGDTASSPKPSVTEKEGDDEKENATGNNEEDSSNNEKPNDDENEETNDIEMANDHQDDEEEEYHSTTFDPLDPEKSNIDPQEEENSNSTCDITEDDTNDQQEVITETPDEVTDIVEETNDVEIETPPVIEPLDEIELQICNIEKSQACFVCKKDIVAKYFFNKKNDDKREFICGDKCFDRLKEHCTHVDTSAGYFSKLVKFQPENDLPIVKFVRKCKQCSRHIQIEHGVCSWEAMDFCKEHCLYRFQLKFTKKCAECAKPVQYSQLGKYSVRFGSLLRQFCSGKCLDVRKKKIRICSFCQLSMTNTDISLGMKFFCSETCKGKYVNLMIPNKPPYIANKDIQSCFICEEKKLLTIEFAHHSISYYFCEAECFVTFKFLQNLNAKVNKCHNCWKYELQEHMEKHGMYYDGGLHYFCSVTCKHIHIITHRRIIPCIWCKVKKYNFDMIHRDGMMSETIYTCSLLCLNHVRAAINHITSKGKNCEQCGEDAAVCDISTVDGKTKSFCSNKCIAEYQSKSRKREIRADKTGQLPVITSVCSLAENTKSNTKELIFIEEEELPEVANKMTSVRLMTKDQETLMVQDKCDSESQTDLKEVLKLRSLPVPIYIPQPLNVWQCPLPRAFPFPLVVPIPLLVPLTRDSSTEYLKSMKYLQKDTVKTPSDPFEAELLMMAELVAAEKPKESEPEEPDNSTEVDFSPEPADGSFNDDMLQMALKMATDYHEPAVDLEGALTANTITPGHHPAMELTSSEDIIHTEPLTGAVRGGPGRGRGRGRGRGQSRGSSSRRGRGRPPALPVQPMPEPTPPPPPPEPVEKPDAHMCLKFTFGVNAWKQWVTTKNADLERSSRKLKLFNNDLLQMTADELNYSLCLFVNEVRKPNGTEYAPDTIYYLCLGIQQYLYESGRIDNIFCDSYYDKFTDCLDDVCSKFSSLYNDSHYIVTRVEEEHLWESKQLGAHSPFVLLTTLMFFNTKHFNLTSVDEHMQLSFSHIMKHWKRNPNASGASRQSPASGRNVLLRFYPPQNTQGNSRKKKVYEQQENEDNPLRCPVKLYEFYLSKCPESVKTRNDVFYLLPERSCVPESPVWYSTMALDLKALKKMLHRVKMVKEINVALLTH